MDFHTSFPALGARVVQCGVTTCFSIRGKRLYKRSAKAVGGMIRSVSAIKTAETCQTAWKKHEFRSLEEAKTSQAA